MIIKKILFNYLLKIMPDEKKVKLKQHLKKNSWQNEDAYFTHCVTCKRLSSTPFVLIIHYLTTPCGPTKQ